ncbi:hypothetical protein GOP47_0003350, partial [Adiantum capillus-veneris]
CFIGKHCYPLFVKVRGAELRELARERFKGADWDSLITPSLVAGLDLCTDQYRKIDFESKEEQIVRPVLQKSFDKLMPQLQVLFSDLVTFWLRADYYGYYNSSSWQLEKQCKWLEMVYGGNPTAAQLRRQVSAPFEPYGSFVLEV